MLTASKPSATSRSPAGFILLFAAALLFPASGAAQQWAVPAHRPISPVVTARSTIGFAPWQHAARGWQLTPALEYASSSEYYRDAAHLFVLDAEFYRVGMTATRDLSPTLFVRAEASLSGMHDGFADAFFDGFHRMMSYEQNGREQRPRNQFEYVAALPGEDTMRLGTASAALGRAAVTLGRRHTSWLQSAITLDLPVHHTYGPARGALSTAHTIRVRPHRNLTWESSAALAWTPRHGPLSAYQRLFTTAFASGAALQVAGRAALYGSVMFHPGAYRDTDVPLLDRGDLSTDFGVLFRTGNGTLWRVGLVEELRFDSGLDLIVKVDAKF